MKHFSPQNAIPLNFKSYPHNLSSRFAQFENNTIDVLQSIEVNIQTLFFEINEVQPSSTCTKIDIIAIQEFMHEWVVKPEFKAFAFESELMTHFYKLNKLIENSRELHDKNKPEIEKIKIVDTYYGLVLLFQNEIKAEFLQSEKLVTIDSALPSFETLFQKSVKYLSKIVKIMSHIENFRLLSAINAENVDIWVDQGIVCLQKFRNISDATVQLIDNFLDLESDLKFVKECDFAVNDDKVVG